MTDFTNYTDDEVLTEAHNVASRLSYYNAAEGNWSREAEARSACQKEWNAIMNEVRSRGLEFENRGYLL